VHSLIFVFPICSPIIKNNITCTKWIPKKLHDEYTSWWTNRSLCKEMDSPTLNSGSRCADSSMPTPISSMFLPSVSVQMPLQVPGMWRCWGDSDHRYSKSGSAFPGWDTTSPRGFVPNHCHCFLMLPSYGRNQCELALSCSFIWIYTHFSRLWDLVLNFPWFKDQFLTNQS
jgi:hypothetical protein